jgi:hypothetical protein
MYQVPERRSTAPVIGAACCMGYVLASVHMDKYEEGTKAYVVEILCIRGQNGRER